MFIISKNTFKSFLLLFFSISGFLGLLYYRAQWSNSPKVFKTHIERFYPDAKIEILENSKYIKITHPNSSIILFLLKLNVKIFLIYQENSNNILLITPEGLYPKKILNNNSIPKNNFKFNKLNNNSSQNNNKVDNPKQIENIKKSNIKFCKVIYS